MRCPPWPYDSQAAQMLYPTSVLGGLRGEAFGSVCVAHVPSRSRCVTDAACRRAVMGGRCVAPFRAHLQRYGTRACTALCLCFPNILGQTSLPICRCLASASSVRPCVFAFRPLCVRPTRLVWFPSFRPSFPVRRAFAVQFGSHPFVHAHAAGNANTPTDGAHHGPPTLSHNVVAH